MAVNWFHQFTDARSGVEQPNSGGAAGMELMTSDSEAARNSTGQLVAAASKLLRQAMEPVDAETEAVLLAAQLAQSLQFQYVCIETDNLQVASLV
ncbi:hypothetical protein JCGZ_15030 [Jatropha curcas]|uniref:RNase H type-1 domain-containing protein n=1 Tax=Jatropha curcas TaxID=180498 RepID=A0A067LKD2_JATCU|nr:hypothetical protein JCGZ_15030 [Jatropha curcas]